MNTPISVLQIQPKFHVRSLDLQEEIVNALDGNKFDVTTAYLSGSPTNGELSTVCKKVKYFNLPKKNLKGLRLSVIFELWKYCREEQFDVIITHRFKPLYIILLVNKFLKRPSQCISILHANGEFERPYRRMITRFLIDKHWKFVGVSKSVKEDMLQYTNTGFTDDNVIYINNSLNIEKMTSGLYSKSSARSHLGIEDDIFVFGTIGRLVNKKGHIYLLEAFKQLHECYPSAKLVIIGEGKLKKTLLSYIHRNKLESSVIMTGGIFDAYHFIKAFDVFVLSSLSEAFGLAILESMIAKVPVIATDVGGVKYVVGEKGKLIPAANTDALFKAMKEHINLNAEQRQLLGDELYSRAVNKFSIEDYHKKYRNLVENF